MVVNLTSDMSREECIKRLCVTYCDGDTIVLDNKLIAVKKFTSDYRMTRFWSSPGLGQVETSHSGIHKTSDAESIYTSIVEPSLKPKVAENVPDGEKLIWVLLFRMPQRMCHPPPRGGIQRIATDKPCYIARLTHLCKVEDPQITITEIEV